MLAHVDVTLMFVLAPMCMTHDVQVTRLLSDADPLWQLVHGRQYPDIRGHQSGQGHVPSAGITQQGHNIANILFWEDADQTQLLTENDACYKM